MAINSYSPTTTPITFETFKEITRSDGTFNTYTDIINAAMTALPVNEELLGVHFNSMREVTGDNIVFKNTEYKTIEWLRKDLADNNSLTLNKMTMFLYNDFMTALDYGIKDKKSTVEWAAIVADTISKMFITKRDVSNMLVIDEMFKVALAAGEFTIINNGWDEVTDANGEPWYNAYKQLAANIARFKFKKQRMRTKFVKGLDTDRYRFTLAKEFSLNLLTGLTAGYQGSEGAYKDIQYRDQTLTFFGTEFNSSIYFHDVIDMNEWKKITGPGQVTVQNPGSHTGNLIKPFNFENILGFAWLPESIKYYGHNFEQTDVPHVDNRTDKVLSFMWRGQVAIHPLYAKLNHVFIDKMPVFKSYETKTGQQVRQYDLNQFADYLQFRKDLRASQPELYNWIINADGTVSNDELQVAGGNWNAYLNKRKMKWLGANWVPFRRNKSDDDQPSKRELKAQAKAQAKAKAKEAEPEAEAEPIETIE